MGKKKTDIIGALIKKMKTNRKFEIAVYVVLIGLAVLIYITSTSTKAKTDTTEGGSNVSVTSSTTAATEQELETRLEDVLSNMQGVGKVKAMIMYDTGVQIVPAMSTDSQTNTSTTVGGDTQTTVSNQTESSTPATISGSGTSEPLILTETQPKVRGVIIIAEGASDISVQLNLTYAVQTVLGISQDCVEVFEMNSSEAKE